MTRHIAAILAALAAASAPLASQSLPIPEPPERELTLAVTLNYPADVNRPPLCTELSLPCSSPRTFPDGGLLVSAARKVTGGFDAIGEAGVYWNGWVPATTTQGPNKRQSNLVMSALAGARIGTGYMRVKEDGSGGLRLTFQLLAGIEGSDETPWRGAVQPGAAVDFRLGKPGTFFRFGADYRWSPGSGRNLSAARSVFGFVMDLDEVGDFGRPSRSR